MSLKSRGAKVDFMPSVESSSQPQFPSFMFSRSSTHRWKLGGDSPLSPPLVNYSETYAIDEDLEPITVHRNLFQVISQERKVAK